MTKAQQKTVKRLQNKTSHPFTVESAPAASPVEAAAIIVHTSWPALRLTIDPAGKLVEAVPECLADARLERKPAAVAGPPVPKSDSCA
jgi:hypothetical protein